MPDVSTPVAESFSKAKFIIVKLLLQNKYEIIKYMKSFLQISFKEIKQSPKLFPIKKRYKIAKSGLVVILKFDSIHKFNIGV